MKSAASDESSVFHDIAEKRFELRFPGAAHKQTNKTNKSTKKTHLQSKQINKQTFLSAGDIENAFVRFAPLTIWSSKICASPQTFFNVVGEKLFPIC